MLVAAEDNSELRQLFFSYALSLGFPRPIQDNQLFASLQFELHTFKILANWFYNRSIIKTKMKCSVVKSK